MEKQEPSNKSFETSACNFEEMRKNSENTITCGLGFWCERVVELIKRNSNYSYLFIWISSALLVYSRFSSLYSFIKHTSISATKIYNIKSNKLLSIVYKGEIHAHQWPIFSFSYEVYGQMKWWRWLNRYIFKDKRLQIARDRRLYKGGTPCRF